MQNCTDTPIILLSDSIITEYSALACCIKIEKCTCDSTCENYVLWNNPSRNWNPLIYNDQAFDVVFILGINVEFFGNEVKTSMQGVDTHFILSFNRSNKDTVTRRAIVRMAACWYLIKSANK